MGVGGAPKVGQRTVGEGFRFRRFVLNAVFHGGGAVGRDAMQCVSRDPITIANSNNSPQFQLRPRMTKFVN